VRSASWLCSVDRLTPPALLPSPRQPYHAAALPSTRTVPQLTASITASATCPRWVAYLGAADHVSRLLPSPLSDVHQPVIRSRNPFSRPHPGRLACLWAHLSHATPRSSTGGYLHIPQQSTCYVYVPKTVSYTRREALHHFSHCILWRACEHRLCGCLP
jgi:hypothetical protein